MQIYAGFIRAIQPRLRLSVLALLMATFANGAMAAVTVVECRDADGNVSYRDRCPPNAAKTGEKQLLPRVKKKVAAADEAPPTAPVVLYAAPGCASCDLVRLHLRGRNVQFTERDAGSDPIIQAELRAAAGTLAVPTLSVGTQAVQGYDGPKIDSALDAAGYPPLKPAAPTSQESTAASTAR